ncbi:hypothetical protein [Dokdonella sp.]|uniref:hypothetical protein n=1 Tax=Dokdonella sp. TaxID=2291710 RepID=UPI0025BF832E|nr:hypothetical protein [Dokdonella sp.]
MQRPILSSLLLAAALGAGCLLNAAPAQARGAVVIYAPSAPPPMRVERMPPPRAGYVWIDGSWAWSHGRYHWNRGHWVRARHGYHYAPPRWERDRHGWHRSGGYWRR